MAKFYKIERYDKVRKRWMQADVHKETLKEAIDTIKRLSLTIDGKFKIVEENNRRTI